MAIARLSVKVGKAGKATPHADYIAREGRYARRTEKGEILEAKESGNMPGWAEANPGEFWRSADAYERVNGTTYREFELALPRELPPEDRAALVRDFVKQELGERHTYQWAIHRPQAADGQDQPHAHVMFSERRLDGIERDPDQFFKRWNAKAPEKGGAHKRFGEVDGPNRSQAQRNADLRALRGRWGEMVNAHLERAGVEARIDMRSYREQGIEDRAPEKKQLPSAWRDPQQRATVLELRQAHRERDETAADLRRLVPDPVSELVHAERRAVLQEAQYAKKRAQVAAITANRERGDAPPVIEQPKAPAPIREQPAPAALAPLPDQVRPDVQEPAPKVIEQPKAPDRVQEAPKAPVEDPERVYEQALAQCRMVEYQAAKAAVEAVRLESRQHYEAIQAHLADKPWTPLGRGKWDRAGVALDATRRELDERQRAAVQRVADPVAIERAAVAELRRQEPEMVAAAEVARQEREAREQDRKQREQNADTATRAREQVAKDFNSLALSRELRMNGYTDHSEKWKATPADLRNRIDEYIKLPKEQRTKELERINRNPKARDRIQELIQERANNVKESDRDMSR